MGAVSSRCEGTDAGTHGSRDQSGESRSLSIVQKDTNATVEAGQLTATAFPWSSLAVHKSVHHDPDGGLSEPGASTSRLPGHCSQPGPVSSPGGLLETHRCFGLSRDWAGSRHLLVFQWQGTRHTAHPAASGAP